MFGVKYGKKINLQNSKILRLIWKKGQFENSKSFGANFRKGTNLKSLRVLWLILKMNQFKYPKVFVTKLKKDQFGSSKRFAAQKRKIWKIVWGGTFLQIIETLRMIIKKYNIWEGHNWE